MDEKQEKPADSRAAKGGRARAQALTPDRRREIASEAAEARWEKAGKSPMPRATHDGPLNIGGIEFECAVLDDGSRVISETKFMETMGMYRSGALSTRRKDEEGGAQIPLSLAHKNLKPYAEKYLGGVHYGPFQFRSKSGGIATGIKAEILPKVCEVWMDANKDGVLGPRQKIVAEKAEILIRGLAHVGIIALIDEATGYQYDRARDALEEYLREFLSDRLRAWVKTFPGVYFKEMCRLRNVVYRPDMRLPQYFGHLTNDVVYKRLAPKVLEELQAKNPTRPSGRRGAKHFQWLSENLGHPKLLQHLGLVIGIMKISDDWETFKQRLNRAAPVYEEGTLFTTTEFGE